MTAIQALISLGIALGALVAILLLWRENARLRRELERERQYKRPRLVRTGGLVEDGFDPEAHG